MARLIVKRKSGFVNFARNFRVILDGQEIGSLRNGDTQEFQISSGSHKLKARIDWCGSEELDFSVSEEQVFTAKISSHKYADLFLALTIPIVIAHYIGKTYGIYYLIWLAIPMIAISFYYVTLGRNKYLEIREDQNSLSF